MGSEVAVELKMNQSVRAQAQGAGTVNGIGVDCQASEEIIAVLDAGTFTTGTADVKLQESDDNSSFADITSAVFAQVTSSNDEAIYVGRVSRRTRPATKRYIRAVSVVATAICPLSVTLIEASVQQMPGQSLAFAV